MSDLLWVIGLALAVVANFIVWPLLLVAMVRDRQRMGRRGLCRSRMWW